MCFHRNGRPLGQSIKSRNKEIVDDSSEKEKEWQEHVAEGSIHSM